MTAPRRGFSRVDDATLRAACDAGKTLRATAELLGRRIDVVSRRAKKLGLSFFIEPPAERGLRDSQDARRRVAQMLDNWRENAAAVIDGRMR